MSKYDNKIAGWKKTFGDAKATPQGFVTESGEMLKRVQLDEDFVAYWNREEAVTATQEPVVDTTVTDDTTSATKQEESDDGEKSEESKPARKTRRSKKKTEEQQQDNE